MIFISDIRKDYLVGWYKGKDTASTNILERLFSVARPIILIPENKFTRKQL